MAGLNFRDTDEFDPDTYAGGLLGRLQAIVQPGQVQPGVQPSVDSGSSSNGAPEFNPGNYDSPQGGLLGRLLAVQMQQGRVDPGAELNLQIPGNSGQNPTVQQTSDFGQTPQTRIIVRPSKAYSPYDPETYRGESDTSQVQQSQYQPVPGSNGPAPFAPQNLEFGQAWPDSNTGAPMIGSSPPSALALALQPQAIQQDEADQARQAREAVAAQLARGVRNLSRSEAPSLDPIDIAKSAGIGLANGVVNAAGLPGDILTGFGYLPKNLVANGVRRLAGYSDLPVDAPDWIGDRATAEPIRHWVERQFNNEFYKPESRAGRYAETIGEMAPLILGGAVFSARRGLQAAALRKLPGTLAKDAVAPGVAVQALEEALPDSKAGQTLQKAYPVLRRVLPAALAAKRYLGRRVVPQ